MACCDTCVNYSYDEDYEYYVCDVDLDEDEMQALPGSRQRQILGGLQQSYPRQ